MDIVNYRLDQVEKRAQIADARMERMEHTLNAIQLTLTGLATKQELQEFRTGTHDSIRSWGLAVIAIVIGSALSASAIVLQSSSNQLAAFQSGLSAIQTIVATQAARPGK